MNKDLRAVQNEPRGSLKEEHCMQKGWPVPSPQGRGVPGGFKKKK